MFSFETQMITLRKHLEDQAYVTAIYKTLKKSRSRDYHLAYLVKCLAGQVNVNTRMITL